MCIRDRATGAHLAETADARRKGERRVAYLLFFYNILLIALFLLCTAAFLLLWRRERQAMFGWAAAAFGAYLADAVLVYCLLYTSRCV